MSVQACQFSFSSLRSEIDSLFAEMEARATALMNQSGSIFGNGFQIDLCETEIEISVTSDLPGFEKENISVRLLDQDTLIIKAEQQIETEKMDDEGTYHLRERRNGCMQRSIHLPSPVTNQGIKASFKNGVMEIVLRKESTTEGVHIEIE